MRLTSWIAADIVVLTLCGGELHVALVRRKAAAAQGEWALPGGFLLEGESAEQAAHRELREEVGLSPTDVRLEQLATYSSPDRDPHHEQRVISVAHLALAANLPDAVAGTDADAAQWTSIADVPELAFDHAQILADGIERARAKLEYATVATAFLEPEFTMSDLRKVYEGVWGQSLDPANFNRKVLGTDGFVVATGEMRRGRGRPAAIYRAGTATVLSPPLIRFPDGVR
ncbi:NUDIX hydrolase [Calidifontibacter terrae]